MTGDAEVALALLDTGFRITSDDPRMIAFVRQLWAPFVVAVAPGGSLPVVIETKRAGWRMEIPGDPGGAATDPWVFAAVLRNALSRRAISEATSVVPLHGAAVERDGAYLVLSGPPKAGKTTLLLELLDRSWRLVTDDLVPIDPSGLTAAPFPKPLNVREPDRWRRFAGLWPVPEWLPAPETVGLIPPTAFPLAPEGCFRPSAIVFSTFDEGAEPSWERLTPARAVAACAANLHPAGRRGAASLAVLARLGTSTPGYLVRYGSSRDALELLEKCLAASDRME